MSFRFTFALKALLFILLKSISLLPSYRRGSSALPPPPKRHFPITKICALKLIMAPTIMMLLPSFSNNWGNVFNSFVFLVLVKKFDFPILMHRGFFFFCLETLARINIHNIFILF